MCTPTCSVIDINKANLDDPMPLDNIGEKRVKSIIVLCKLKEYYFCKIKKTMPGKTSVI